MFSKVKVMHSRFLMEVNCQNSVGTWVKQIVSLSSCTTGPNWSFHLVTEINDCDGSCLLHVIAMNWFCKVWSWRGSLILKTHIQN